MEIEWALALANFIRHAHYLEMARRFDAFIGPHKVLCCLADKRSTHHVRHKLSIRPLLILNNINVVKSYTQLRAYGPDSLGICP